MPPATVAKLVVLRYVRVSTVTFPSNLHPYKPSSCRGAPKLVYHHLRFYGLQRFPLRLCSHKSEFYTPFSAQRPSRTKAQNHDLPSCFLTLYIPNHQAFLIRLVHLFNRSFFPTSSLGNRVRCRATDVCIHSVNTLVR